MKDSVAVKGRWPRAGGGAWSRPGQRRIGRRWVRNFEAQNRLEADARKRKRSNGVRTEAATGDGSGPVGERGKKQKAGGTSSELSTGLPREPQAFTGLVQHRMELTLRCAPVNSILWILGSTLIGHFADKARRNMRCAPHLCRSCRGPYSCQRLFGVATFATTNRVHRELGLRE